jgi:Fe2+ or Zn2+ uptake regulation protein
MSEHGSCQNHAGDDSRRIGEVFDRQRESGYALTAQRRTLVDLIFGQEHLFSADDLLGEAQKAGRGIGRATVFRTLEILTRLGYLGRVTDGGREAYTVCATGHHHHLVCTGCGQVLHFDGCPIDDLMRDLESRTGFRIRDHRVDMAGLCPNCQE